MRRMNAVLGAAVVAGTMMISTLVMTEGAALKNVRDPLGRFTISVPATWNVQTSTSSRAAAVTTAAPATSGLPDSVDVIVQDTSSALSPQACVGEADMVMRFTIHSWTTVQQGATTLGGLPAYSRVYVWRAQTGQQRESVQSCVTRGRRAFMVVGTTANTPLTVREHLPQLQQIMNTFRPLASAPPPEAPATPGLGH
ncbi:MAG TPA: hypothetical protein VFP86_17370 [bacterium]|nr:hypothetical protein [bacterium]